MIIRKLGLQEYEKVWRDMQEFTQTRGVTTQDELWILQHYPVYTQGQAGKAEHILNPANIPIVQSDRGGQVTYHGPGQLIGYVLMDISAKKLGVRTLVCKLEQTIINTLQEYNISAHRKDKAPGVYVDNAKIASIGLRVKNGCTYHGIALNVDLELKPFYGINPCGYKELKITQIKDFTSNISIEDAENKFCKHFQQDIELYSK